MKEYKCKVKDKEDDKKQLQFIHSLSLDARVKIMSPVYEPEKKSSSFVFYQA